MEISRRWKDLFVFCCILVSTQVMGTTFLPIPFEKQVRESNGAILARYQGRQFKQLEKGKVFTEARFKVLKHTGLTSNEIINKNLFSVIYPGGHWNGLNYQVNGSPQFQRGETYLLLLKQSRNGPTVTNLALGQYDYVNTKESKHFVSTVFPNHVSLGEISFDRADRIFSQEYGGPLKEVESDLFVHKGGENGFTKNLKKTTSSGRSPASLSNRRKPSSMTKDSHSNAPLIWIILVFFTLGVVASFRRKKKN